ncbi:MAG: efflux RND transporter periplasmic adaptor subunit [Thermotogota bacterium]
MKKAFIFIIIIIIAVISVFFIINNNKDTDKNTDQKNVENIFTTYTIENTRIGDYIEITGTVEADERNVVSEVSGKVTELYIEKGQKVSEGDLLAKFEDLEYRIAYLNDLRNFELAVNDSPKIKEIKELQLELSKRNLENTELKSPVEGTISDVYIGEDDFVPTNQNIISIVDTNSLRIESVVDEIDLSKIHVGMQALVEFDQLNASIPAEINLINPVAVNSGGLTTIPIELNFTEDANKFGVIPGITGNVKLIILEAENEIVIPTNALNQDGKGNFFVFLKTENEPEKINIEIGEKTDDRVIVKSGLEFGQTLVIYPDQEELERLKDKYEEKNPFGPAGQKKAPGGGK